MMAEESWTFAPSPQTYATLGAKDVVALLNKWDLGNASLRTFCFGTRFEESSADKFLLDLWNSAAVRAELPLATKSRTLEPMPSVEAALATSVRWSRVPTTATRMDLFDPLYEERIVREETGRIAGCAPERFDGVEADDRLRQLMVNEDAEEFLAISGAHRSELLFRIARLLTVGGSMCQHEDDWNVYARVIKGAYKDLVTVHKASSAGGIEIASAVFAVSSVEGVTLFPEDSPHSHCLVVVDPIRRRVHVWYSAFVSFW